MAAPGSLHAIARRQWRDYQAGTPGRVFEDPDLALSLDDAYVIQAEVARLRVAAGDAVVGYKIGCTGPGIARQFGVSGPVYGRLYASEVHRSGCRLPASAYTNLAVEAEMAIRLGEDLAVEDVFAVIELHNLVFRAARPTLVELVANNCINAGVVLPAADDGPNDVGCTTLSLAMNGVPVDNGELWAFAGGPGEALSWLTAALGTTGEVLRPNDIVLAGTPLGLHQVDVENRVGVLLDGKEIVSSSITS